MTSKNDITGDSIVSKTSNKKYEEGWERIFGNKQAQQDLPTEEELAEHKNQAQDRKNG